MISRCDGDSGGWSPGGTVLWEAMGRGPRSAAVMAVMSEVSLVMMMAVVLCLSAIATAGE